MNGDGVMGRWSGVHSQGHLQTSQALYCSRGEEEMFTVIHFG